MEKGEGRKGRGGGRETGRRGSWRGQGQMLGATKGSFQCHFKTVLLSCLNLVVMVWQFSVAM